MSDISLAINLLRQGKLVAMPTETVYGLAADAMNGDAVARVFAVKDRPTSHPLIVHIDNAQALPEWAEAISDDAWRLANHFWPGPLTLILNKKASVLDLVTANQATVALRVPSHPVAQALLHAFGGGLVAPSANRFTRVSPTTSDAVREELGEKVDLILEGGASEVGIESTIIDMHGDVPMLLRPGAISLEAMENVLKKKIAVPPYSNVRAPGMHKVHYAPKTPVQLLSAEVMGDYLELHAGLTVGVMGLNFGRDASHGRAIEHVQMPLEAVDYARELYQTLRRLDHAQYDVIVIEAVPRTAAWDAIRDRLSKAAALSTY